MSADGGRVSMLWVGRGRASGHDVDEEADERGVVKFSKLKLASGNSPNNETVEKNIYRIRPLVMTNTINTSINHC